MPLPILFPRRKLAPLAAAMQEGPAAVEAEAATRLIAADVATVEEVAPFVDPVRLPGVTAEAARRAALPIHSGDPRTFETAVLLGNIATIGAVGGIAAGVLGPALAGSGLLQFAKPTATLAGGLVEGITAEEPMPNGNGFISGLGDVFTGLLQTGATEIGIPLLRQELLQQRTGFLPMQTRQPFSLGGSPAVRTAAAAPVVAGAAAAAAAAAFRVGTVALNTVVAAMRSRGVQATVNKAAAFVKRFGPQAAVTFFAGFVGADVANRAVLEAAFIKRRRMNAGNTKALRRAVRRVQSFHRLCRRADVIAGPRRRTRTRRCTVCRVDPCRC